MQTDLKTVKKTFAKSIEKYSQNAVVQKLMAHNLAENITNFSKKFVSVLEIGAGAGILSEQLAKKICFEKFYANDLTEKSEKFVKKFIPSSKFFAGDFRRINFNTKFDLIASNAVFQWFDNPEKILNKCFSMLNSNGILAFTAFNRDNFYELKNLTGLTLDYRNTEEWISYLLNQDFKVLYNDNFEHVLTFDNPLEILAHLKKTGVNSLARKPLTVTEVKNLCDKYRQTYPELSLTYKPIVFIAQKA